MCYAIRNYSEIELFTQVNQLYCQSVKELKNALDMFLCDCSRLWKVGCLMDFLGEGRGEGVGGVVGCFIFPAIFSYVSLPASLQMPFDCL